MSVCVCCETIFIKSSFFDFGEILGKITKVIGLEIIVCLEVYSLIIIHSFFNIISKRILEVVFCWFFLENWRCGLRIGLRKVIEIEISKIIAIVFNFVCRSERPKIRKGISFCFFIWIFGKIACLWVVWAFIENISEGTVIYSEFKLIDIIRNSCYSKYMSIYFVHKVKVDIQ